MPKLVTELAGAFQAHRHAGPMFDSAGFLTVSIASALAIVVVFAALLWAAVQDGRDERAYRRSHPRR